jgi:amino acid transporter
MTEPPDSQPASSSASPASAPRLRPVLGLWDLVFYGIVLIQPVGGVGIFGLANKESAGHVSTTILVALVAMMLTAVSYGRMAGLYPVAGSAYAYVGRGLNPHLGFIAGWAMFLDYLVIPVISVVYGGLTTQKLLEDSFPGLTQKILSSLHLGLEPQHAGFVVWVILFVALSTFLNLRGIKWTAHTNHILTAVMFLVIAIFTVDAVRFLMAKQGWTGLFSTEPFYNPKTFDVVAIGKATSLAALTYIGFDGITTLAEDVREPKKTVPLAIVLVCFVIGLCAVLQTYLGQRVWPDYNSIKEADLPTAFFDVCRLAGGKFLFDAMTATLVVASLGSALTGQVGAARILFGMGRDNALPRFFARLDKGNNPVLNIWLIGIVVLTASLLLNYEGAADLINFGAFLAFIGVNAAVVREFWFRPPAGHQRGWFKDLIVPGLGLLFCVAIWCFLPAPAKIVGGVWCAIGLIYTGIRTRGFTRQPVMLDLSGS